MAIAFAFGSAALFGLSTPVAKFLLGEVHPVVLAGLFYCGAGLGVAALRRLRADFVQTAQTPLARRDIPWLVGSILAGGVAGPLLLMIGLAQTEASTASLLLAFEGAATAVIARVFFGESYGPRLVLGMTLLVGGAAVLSWSGAPTLGSFTGPLAIIAACFAWAFDNNLTRKISLADPLQIVEIKGLAAGPVNLALGLWSGGFLPPAATSLVAGAVGFVSYGLSLVLFVLALRGLGAARTSAYFATAPFLGALGAVAGLGDPMTLQLAGAGLLMGLGAWLHLTEQHEHEHLHAALEHSHSHRHDDHHRHTHEPSDVPGEPHAHPHRHEPTRHMHVHAPDAHHDHGHP